MRKLKTYIFLSIIFVLILPMKASYVFIPMDESQANHLKAYGIAFWILKNGGEADWLLNYKGGSFATKQLGAIESECVIRGVTYQIIADAQYTAILSQIANPEVNADVVKLEKAPKIAVYSPKTKQPWDDAVTMVLTYAEIPYDIIYDDEIMSMKLPTYDWLHLHHEDFTGQQGKFYAQYANAEWFQAEKNENEAMAKKWGLNKVSKLKLEVAKRIKEFVSGGGFLFAMCSATDSYDICLEAEGTDICAEMFDGDAQDPSAQSKLDFSKGLAFENYRLHSDPYEYEYSDIDANVGRSVPKDIDYFTLFDFSAKWDQVPTMLTQCHTKTIKGFMGQTTSFNKDFVKKNVLIMGENKSADEAKYIHGEMGKGMWTFYGGHDPEDYQHFVGDPKTDLNLHPTSTGYRLILNNVLFPAAKKKKQKT
jgi:hypothetical protein